MKTKTHSQCPQNCEENPSITHFGIMESAPTPEYGHIEKVVDARTVQLFTRAGKIAVTNVNKHVKNLIIMARLITVFKSFESEDDAVAALQHLKVSQSV